MAMPESIPAPLIIDTYKDIFRAERNGARLAAGGYGRDEALAVSISSRLGRVSLER